MPDPAPDPTPWYKDATKLILVLVAIGTLFNTVGQAIQGVIASMHGQKLDKIENVQAENGKKIDSAHQAVTVAAEKATIVAEKQDKIMATLPHK